MAKNGYLEKREADRQEYFRAGIEIGRQQIIDMLSLALRKKEYVGKDTFGSGRLLKILAGISKELDYWMPAWQKSDETDVYRDKLDENLAEAYGQGIKVRDPFIVRYPSMPEYDYQKGRWK